MKNISLERVMEIGCRIGFIGIINVALYSILLSSNLALTNPLSHSIMWVIMAGIVAVNALTMPFLFFIALLGCTNSQAEGGLLRKYSLIYLLTSAINAMFLMYLSELT